MDSAPFIGFYGNDFFDMDENDNLINSALNFLEKIKSYLKDTSIKTIAKQGDFATIILETAASRHVDIIVLGTHSKNWLERAVVGSVTASVLAKTQIPMFVLPVKEHE
jgi:nucleotide-binding universal stress UspA family protein